MTWQGRWARGYPSWSTKAVHPVSGPASAPGGHCPHRGRLAPCPFRQTHHHSGVPRHWRLRHTSTSFGSSRSSARTFNDHRRAVRTAEGVVQGARTLPFAVMPVQPERLHGDPHQVGVEFHQQGELPLGSRLAGTPPVVGAQHPSAIVRTTGFTGTEGKTTGFRKHAPRLSEIGQSPHTTTSYPGSSGTGRSVRALMGGWPSQLPRRTSARLCASDIDVLPVRGVADDGRSCPSAFRRAHFWPCPKYAATCESTGATATALPPSRSDTVAA